jgi:hypothetical protein
MEEIQFGYSAKELTDANGEMQLEVDLKINPVDIKLIQTENFRECNMYYPRSSVCSPYSASYKRSCASGAPRVSKSA